MAMHVGIVEFEFRLHGCRSLKEKRQVLRSLIDGLRHHFNASVAEVDHQDEWQRAAVAAAVVNGDRRLVERLLEELIDFAESRTEAELVNLETEIL